VETRADFISRPDTRKYDLILADYNKSSFDGISAIQIRLEHNQDAPLIIVADALDEEKAIKCLKAGVIDYVLKDRLWRLVPVVMKALQEKGKQRKRKQTEETLKAYEQSYQEIFNATNEVIFIHDMNTNAILDANRPMLEMFGCSYEEAIRFRIEDISAAYPPYTQKEAQQWVTRARDEGPQLFEWLCKRCNGDFFWGEVRLKAVVIGGEKRVLAVVRDITERKRAVEKLRENDLKYQSLYQEFEGILDAIPDSLILINPDLKVVWANNELATLLKKNISELIGQYCYQIWHSRTKPCEVCPVQRCFRSGKPENEEITIPDVRIWDVRGVPLFGDQGEVKNVIEVARNITGKKRSEEKTDLFAYSVSHDLKNPAIGLYGLPSILKNAITISLMTKEGISVIKSRRLLNKFLL
jgi:PAS domain S-box-containing protein